MIIQCPKCHTRFKIGEDKLKPEGIKVRCAKCHHIFTVFPPEPAEPVGGEEEISPLSAPDEAGDPWADSFNEVLEDSHPSGTPTDADTSSWDEALDSGFADEAAESVEAPAEIAEESGPTTVPLDADSAELDAAALGLEDDEATPAPADSSLSSFTAEPLISEEIFAETSMTSVEETAQETFATGGEEEEFQFEEVGEEEEFVFEETPATETEPFTVSSTGDELLFAESESAEKSLFAEGAEGKESIAEFSFQEEGVEAFSFEPGKTELSEDSALQEDDLFAPQPASEMTDSFFDEAPQSDDLYPDNPSETEEKGFEFSDSEGAVAIDRPTAEPSIAVAPLRSTEERTPALRGEELPEPLSEPRPKAAASKRSPMVAVLRIFILLLLLLAAFAGYLAWRGGTDSLPRILSQLKTLTGTSAPAEPAVHIRLPLPNSFFVMNEHVGQLFVIQGEAVNGYPEPRSAISVTGMLHDGKGDVLLRQTVFCGNPMDLETLKSAPFVSIQETMSNPFGSALANVNIAPDTPIPYMIVFRDLPDNVTHFTVEVADSKTGEAR